VSIHTRQDSFDDWAAFKVGVTNVGGDGNGPFGDDVDITEFDYRNDDTHLYLFFKCKPTIEERYRKTGTSGMFGYFYLDSDSSRQTGATKIDLSGESAMLGTEVQIVVSIGIFSRAEPDKPVQSGCFVSYDLKSWNSSANDFSHEIREEESRAYAPLIAHGKDGIEIAIALKDLNKRKGDQFDFICLEAANCRAEFANRVRINLD
jgi:hypothetical protein